jgi:hypothetical protein
MVWSHLNLDNSHTWIIEATLAVSAEQRDQLFHVYNNLKICFRGHKSLLNRCVVIFFRKDNVAYPMNQSC